MYVRAQHGLGRLVRRAPMHTRAMTLNGLRCCGWQIASIQISDTKLGRVGIPMVPYAPRDESGGNTGNGPAATAPHGAWSWPGGCTDTGTVRFRLNGLIPIPSLRNG